MTKGIPDRIVLPVLMVVLHLHVAGASSAQAQILAPAFDQAARNAVVKWASSRGCLYTEGAALSMERTLRLAKPAFDTKVSQEKLSREKSVAVLDAAVASYLDRVTLRAFGPSRANCFVDLDHLMAARLEFPPMVGPGLGYLEVDGEEKGAAIKIDGGKQRGAITQTFALSVGRHTWETMTCKGTVDIRAGDFLRVFCRKQ